MNFIFRLFGHYNYNLFTTLSMIAVSRTISRKLNRSLKSQYFNRNNNMTTSTSDKAQVKFRFLEEKSGDTIEVKGEVGKSVLDVAIEYNIDIEGGCGGQMACSTWYKNILSIQP